MSIVEDEDNYKNEIFSILSGARVNQRHFGGKRNSCRRSTGC